MMQTQFTGTIRQWALLLAGASLLLTCADPRPAVNAKIPLHSTATLDLGSVIQQVHSAFRREGPQFVAARDTYRVNATRDGAFTMTGYHYPAGTRSSAPLVAPPLRVHTAAVTGLDGGLAPPSEARMEGAGGLLFERGQVRERLKPAPDGIEQSWEILAHPAGAGDLMVRVCVSGLAFVSRSATGLHFADAATGLGLRYGAATWIDAGGRTTPIEVGFSGDQLQLTVPRAVLDDSAYPALLDPYLSPEFGMDSPVRGPGLDSWDSVAAFDGTNYLVVWSDDQGSVSHLYGTRVSATGTVIDPFGISVGTTTSPQTRPAIAFNGTSYLVAWQQGSSTYKVYTTRIDPAGVVLDPNGIAMTNSYNSELNPAIASDGTNFLLAWAIDQGSGGKILAARMGPTGAVLDKTAATVSSITSTYAQVQMNPAIAFDGTNFLIAWQDLRGSTWDIYANRISQAAVVLDGNGFAVANGPNAEETPAIAFDGANYLVAWEEWLDTTTRDSSIIGRRVSPAGALIDAAPLTLAAAPGEQSEPTVAFDGTNSLVAWTDYRAGGDSDILGVRVGKDGTLVDSQPLPMVSAAGAQFGANLIAGGGGLFMTWADSRAGASTVYAARFDANGASQDGSGVVLPSVPNLQQTPAVASDGTNYLVVWSDSRTGGPSIYAIRVGPQGALLDSSAIRVSATAGWQNSPLVAWNGSSYLVLWVGHNTPVGRRVSPDGTILDNADITLPAPQQISSITSNGSDFLIVGSKSYQDIEAARISSAGIPLDTTGITISSAGGSQFYPRATFDGTNYFVVWQDSRAGTHIYGARVAPTGAVLDPDGILLSSSPGASGYQHRPDVAFDGSNSLVVWEDSRNSGIWGVRVTPAGTLLDPAGATLFSPPTTNDLLGNPGIVFNGTNYLVSWRDTKYSSSYSLLSYTTYAGRVSPTLSALDRYTIFTDPTEDPAWAMASDGTGGAILTWAFPSNSDGYPVERIRARILSESPPAGSCTTAAQCPSKFCADGVCCDSACGGGSTVDCVACSIVAGAAQDGVCGPVADGRGCDDGNACTRFDTCLAGTCVSAGSTCGSSNDGGANDARAGYGETRDAALDNSLDGTTDGRAIDGIGSDRVNLPQSDALAGIDVRADAAATDSAPAVPDRAPSAIDSASPAPDSAPIAADDAPTADSAPTAANSAPTEADGGVTMVDGASGTTGSDAARSTSSTSGCNCNIGARGGSRHSLWLGLALAALLILRRRGHLDSRN